jgi:hypothetical protein
MSTIILIAHGVAGIQAAGQDLLAVGACRLINPTCRKAVVCLPNFPSAPSVGSMRSDPLAIFCRYLWLFSRDRPISRWPWQNNHSGNPLQLTCHVLKCQQRLLPRHIWPLPRFSDGLMEAIRPLCGPGSGLSNPVDYVGVLDIGALMPVCEVIAKSGEVDARHARSATRCRPSPARGGNGNQNPAKLTISY